MKSRQVDRKVCTCRNERKEKRKVNTGWLKEEKPTENVYAIGVDR